MILSQGDTGGTARTLQWGTHWGHSLNLTVEEMLGAQPKPYSRGILGGQPAPYSGKDAGGTAYS